jgi:hypothetical protein
MLAYIIEAFPPDDLAFSLTETYFTRVNVHWPLLHRQTFERQRKQGLHERDLWFAALCMSVFAAASRWSHDLRVLPEEERNAACNWHRAGWHWFEIVVELQQARSTYVHPAGLFEVQTLCVSLHPFDSSCDRC